MRKQNAISSKIADIAKLAFYPLPTVPTKVARAIRVEKVLVVIGENGRVYTSEIQDWTYWTRIERLSRTVAGLIKLGMLTDEAVAQHKAAVKTEAEATDRRRASLHILESIEAAGVKLTKAQLAKLEAQARRPGAQA